MIMTDRSIFTLPTLTLIGVLLISACGTAVPTEKPGPATAAANTPVPMPTTVETAAAVPTDIPAGVVDQLILATTTSTDDSGLLDYILPDFEAICGCDVNVVAVGSGQALQLGMDGNADVLLVHSAAGEKEFMDNGHGVRREDVM